jgi:hypothetical protein
MQLITMHKILMTTAIFSGLSFSAWSVLNWTHTGHISALIIAVISALGTAGIGLYLKRFIAKNRPAGPS